MEKIFYTNKCNYPSSEEAVKYLLKEYFGIANAEIVKNENGKPYLVQQNDLPLFFSISHTKDWLFIAFSRNNIGIDAECMDRKVDYQPIVKKFSLNEQKEIQTTPDFLHHWTAKESAIKWLGGSIAKDLNSLSFINGKLAYKGEQLPVKITFKNFENILLAICAESDLHPTPFTLFP